MKRLLSGAVLSVGLSLAAATAGAGNLYLCVDPVSGQKTFTDIACAKNRPGADMPASGVTGGSSYRPLKDKAEIAGWSERSETAQYASRAFLSGCDRTGCWDTEGHLYAYQRDSDYLLRQDGSRCTTWDSIIECKL